MIDANKIDNWNKKTDTVRYTYDVFAYDHM